MNLVLSIFPGVGLLDRAFEAEDFCVVRGPDPIWGGDIRGFYPPSYIFDGVIGGDPCQSHSALANLVRAKGLEPSFPDLTGEFLRIVETARPQWFLRENVPKAPDIKPYGYDVRSFLLDNHASFGEEQMRLRRFWFGTRNVPCPELRSHMKFALDLPIDPALTVNGAHDHLDGAEKIRARRQSVTARHSGEIGLTGGHRGSPGHYTLAEMLELQGLPTNFLDHCPFTMQGKRKAIGNGVPQAMGRALAKAIKKAMK
jgi:DNA (cytosine-5)-methyltransferase 1